MYLNHLALLSEDSSLKAKDRQKMKGYLLQWCNGKLLLGCALFLDILKPAAVLCKVLQDGELCIVAAIESIWKTQRHMDQLEQTSALDLPSVKHILSTMHHFAGESTYLLT